MKIRTSDVSWRSVGDEIIVLDLERSLYLTINASGVPLWNALAEGATYDELVETLVKRYEIDETTARRDAQTFCDSLLDCRLIEVTGR